MLISDGVITTLTQQVTQVYAVLYSTFPNRDSTGAVIGLPVRSFYQRDRWQFPGIVVRVIPGGMTYAGIGALFSVELNQMPPLTGFDYTDLPPDGWTIQGVLAPKSTIELRMIGRSEVERERMLDWAISNTVSRRTLPDGSPPLIDQLGALGIICKAPRDPVIPPVRDRDPAAQGTPPYPAQLFIPAIVELQDLVPPTGASVGVAPTSLDIQS